MKQLYVSLIAILALFGSNAFAIEMSKAEKDEIANQVSQQVTDKITKEVTAAILSKTPAPEKVDQLVGIGKQLAMGLGAAAKELGIAANDFAKTPVGIFTAVMIGWHYMGESASEGLHRAYKFFGVLVFWAVWFTMTKRPFNNMVTVESFFENKEKPTVVTRTLKSRLTTDGSICYGLLTLLGLIIGVFIMFI